MEGFNLNAAEISTLVTALATVIYTVGTFLLWKSSRDTARLIRNEVRNQSANSQSVADSSAFDAHRTLILEVLRDEHLLKTFSSELGMSSNEARTKFLASLFINQARRIYLDRARGLSKEPLATFEEDARELFSFPFIKKRWLEVRELHPQAFRTFVEKRLLPAS